MPSARCLQARLFRVRRSPRRQAGWRKEMREVEVQRPAHDHEDGKQRGHGDGAGRGVRSPGDRYGQGDERNKSANATGSCRLASTRHAATRRYTLNAAEETRSIRPGCASGPHSRPGDDQGCGQCKTNHDVEDVRPERLDADHADAR